MIGKDFPPNDFLLFGLDLTDPTDFIYDVILGILSLYFAYKINRFKYLTDFFNNWKHFFFYFGLAAFISGFGHLFYNYFHYVGKIPGWIMIPISIYWIERSMLSAHNKKMIKNSKRVFLIKIILVYVICFIVWLVVDPFEKPEKLFLPIAINTIVGLAIVVGFYSFKFSKEISLNFRYIIYGVLIISPSAVIFLLKINLHQWFDNSDFSHVLMIFGIAFFFAGVKKLQEDKSFIERL